MGRRAYSDDLRGLVVAEVAAGASRRSAGRRFKVSASSAVRWVDYHAETGSLSPLRKRKPRSPLEQHASWLLELIARGGPDPGGDRATAVGAPWCADHRQFGRSVLQTAQDELQKKSLH